jgi:predicted  nucleic acid-binding Zn-ribbon protein
MLLKLAEIDTSIEELNETLAHIPDAVKALERQIQTIQTDMTSLESKRAGLEAQKKQAEDLITEKKSWIENRDNQVKDIKTNKEYHAALKEVSLAKKEVADNETKITTLIDQIAEAAKQIEDIKTANATQIEDVKKQIAEHDVKLAVVNPQIEEKRKSRGGVVVEIEQKWLTAYEQVRSRVTPAISKAENFVCTECGTKILPQLYNHLFTAAEIFTCPRCKRILYVEEFLNK